MRRLLLIAILLVWQISNAAAAQYVCGTREETAEEGVRAADVIFLGRVDEILHHDERDEAAPRLRMFESLVRFEVLESFKGAEKGPLLVGWGWEGFIVEFEVGETYLVYAYGLNSGEYLGVDTCTRTRPLALAGPDLEYLRRPSTGTPETRLTGSVARWDDDVDGYRPFEGIKVTAIGRGVRQETRTDTSGAYRFPGIPPGEYEVQFDVPRALGSDSIVERVTLAKGEWRGPDYVVEDEARVVGILVGPDGKPLAEADVTAVALDDARDGSYDSADEVFTGPDGRFEFKDLDPGDYVIVANSGDAPDPDSPFRRTFFPGSREFAGAEIVTVDEGKETRLPVFRIPHLSERSVLHGVVVNKEGEPVKETRIEIHQEDSEWVDGEGVMHSFGWNSYAVTDTEGRFSASLLVGVNYELWIGELDRSGKTVPVKVRPKQAETSVRIVVPLRSPDTPKKPAEGRSSTSGAASLVTGAQGRKLTDADYRKLEEALELFEKAVELDPKSPLNDFYILMTYNLQLQYWMTKRDGVPPEEVKRVDEEIDRILDKMHWIRPSPLDDRLVPGFRPGELLDAPMPKKSDTPVGAG